MFSSNHMLTWIGLIVLAILIVIPHFKLWQRAGYSGWWSLLMVIPVINVISLWVLALISWPIERDLDASR